MNPLPYRVFSGAIPIRWQVRQAAKGLGETLLLASGAQRFELWMRRRRTLVLAYHNVIPAGHEPCGDRSLHLTQASFGGQLDALLSTHDVLPLSRLGEESCGQRPRAVITFDDAYRGAVTAGVSEVIRRGLPATVFVAPGLFGTSTWWDRLAEAAGGAVPPVARERALRTHLGRAERVLQACGPGATELPSWAGIATEAEVLAAAAMPGITLGAHTWSHPNLTALEPDDLTGELERPLAWLRQSGVRCVPWLAYPYGLTSPAVARRAAEAGYLGAFRIDGGWMPAGAAARAHDLPRLNVPSGLSVAGFRLRTSGLLSSR